MSASRDRLTAFGRVLDPVALLEAFLEVFEGLVVVLDRASRILVVNHVAERVSGRDREEVRGRLFTRVFCAVPGARAAFQSALEARLRSRPSGRHVETRCVSKDGTEHLVRWTFAGPAMPSGRRRAAGALGKGAVPRGLIAMGAVVRHDRERLRGLEYEMVGIEEKLRRRFGQELHDTLASHLAGTAMLSASVMRQVERGNRVEGEQLRELTELVDEAVEQVRVLSHSFVAAELEAESLAAAIEQLAERAESTWRARCTCRVEAQNAEQMPTGETALHLCRIAQEAVRNAMQHADPSQVEIALETRDDPSAGAVLVLEVCDDGRGMPEGVEEGVGLRGMRRRARLAGAVFEVEEVDGGGTCVRCTLPLKTAS